MSIYASINVYTINKLKRFDFYANKVDLSR